jgi:hypothetical protein
MKKQKNLNEMSLLGLQLVLPNPSSPSSGDTSPEPPVRAKRFKKEEKTKNI